MRILAFLACFALCPSAASAQQPARALTQSIAVWQMDALGIEPEIVARLESLFRTELERLSGKRLPSQRAMNRKLSRRLRRCDGATKCLAAIGKKVGVDLVVSGNIAQLGDSYVVNLKVIEVANKTEVRRIVSDPLRGNADELIEAVRVAAYRLVAPDELHGSIAVLTDLVGADITLDDELMGKTPLKKALTGLALGEHILRVTADNHTPFEQKVRVRFQKTTRVVVRLIKAKRVPIAIAPIDPNKMRPPPDRWYNSTWFYVTVGLGAVLLGGYVGYGLAHDEVIDCSARPMACN